MSDATKPVLFKKGLDGLGSAVEMLINEAMRIGTAQGGKSVLISQIAI
ncbi:MAG: hypothetical protein QNK11_01300 [Legionella sp.]|nr:hypothetical protein [Legionella sp.]